MRQRRQFREWFRAPIARGWALTAFITLAIGIGFAVDGVHQQGRDGRDRGIESRQAIVATGRIVAVEGCNRDYRFGKAVRGVLIASKVETLRNIKSGDISEARAKRAIAFYDEQLGLLKLPDCRQSRKVITSDLDRVSKQIPVPLHPPDRP